MEYKGKQLLSQDKFAAYNGIELLELSLGKAKAKMEIQPHHLNGFNIVHGGALFTLADFAFGAASNSHGTMAVSINASISFIKPARQGTLIAEAKEIALHPKLGSYTVHIFDEQNEIIAIFQGMAYRKQEKII